MLQRFLAILLSAALLAGCAEKAPEAAAPDANPHYDALIKGGLIVDGGGGAPYKADLAIKGDRIAAIGDLGAAHASILIDARGKAVAPGFINMLSWAVDSLMIDGAAQSDIRQGVTLEVFGEGFSMGPMTEEMKRAYEARQGDIKYKVTWTTLGEYLERLEQKGIAPNVASFVGATSLRLHEIGAEDRPPTPEELIRMQALTRQAMGDGALGVGSSLIYAPAFYAQTDELVALMKAAAPYGGMYISHLRSEGNRLLEAVDELIQIARESGAPAEIYHFKAAGKRNWGKLDAAIAKIEKARAEGLRITADMYSYTAGATGLDAAMPPWVQAGGLDAWVERLKNPDVRAKVIAQMRAPSDDWENLLLAAGAADNVRLVEFKSDTLKPLTGKTLAEVAKMRGASPEATAIDLVIEDHSQVGAVYFLMSEANVRRKAALPWVSFGSDAGAPAAEGVFLKSSPHPRAYGNFARVLGQYVREDKLLSLAEAIRKLSALPAETLKLRARGRLEKGYYADVVIFDPATISDHATYDRPHQYASGVAHVFVNGEQILADGAPTGKRPGRVVRGPGWTGWAHRED